MFILTSITGPPIMSVCGNEDMSKEFVTDNILGKFE